MCGRGGRTEGILADFLRDTKAEVVGVSIFEFDRDEYERQQREEVAHDKAVCTARNMLRMGFSREQIAQATELPLSEVAALGALHVAGDVNTG